MIGLPLITILSLVCPRVDEKRFEETEFLWYHREIFLDSRKSRFTPLNLRFSKKKWVKMVIWVEKKVWKWLLRHGHYGSDFGPFKMSDSCIYSSSLLSSPSVLVYSNSITGHSPKPSRKVRTVRTENGYIKNVRIFFSILGFSWLKMSEKWSICKNDRKFSWFMFHDMSSPKCLIKMDFFLFWNAHRNHHVRFSDILHFFWFICCHFYIFWSSFWHFSLWPSHFLIFFTCKIFWHFHRSPRTENDRQLNCPEETLPVF